MLTRRDGQVVARRTQGTVRRRLFLITNDACRLVKKWEMSTMGSLRVSA